MHFTFYVSPEIAFQVVALILAGLATTRKKRK
jgi:hypothetical protein